MVRHGDPTRERAIREFAESRARLRWPRLAFYAVAGSLGAAYIPLGWIAACLVAILAADLIEGRAARALLAAGEGTFERRWRELAVAHLTEASAVALLLVAAWHFAEPGHMAFPLCLSFAIAFVVAVRCKQVRSLMMLRQGVYGGLAMVMAGRNLLLEGPVTLSSIATDFLPVAAFAGYALWLAQATATAYRSGLEREHELAKARDAAERAQEARSRLIATISHELRTPLNGIIGMAQALLAGTLAPGLRRQIEVIAESGRNLNALLNDILDFSKLEAGHLAISPVEDDPREPVRHVESLFRPVAEQKGLDFEVRIDDGMPERLVLDAVRVRQCLANLVSNAIKFTEAGAVTVSVAAEPAGPAPDGTARWRVAVFVSDTGIGIPVEDQRRLFSPFSQADGSIGRRYGGTGLGLSITRHLAEAMGGEVTLESAAGSGTTFRLTFVAEAAEGDAAASRAETENPAGRPSRRRVLVADDAQTNRMVIRLFLEPLGVETVEVADGRTALSVLARGEFDAAFIDLHMPGMDGPELAERIRRGEAGRPDLPLVAVSGSKRAESALDDFDAWVGKPIDPAHLRASLESILAAPVTRGSDLAKPGASAAQRS